MSAAACKEEENCGTLIAMSELKDRISLFEMQMAQGIASTDQIERARVIDADLVKPLAEANRRYQVLSRHIAETAPDDSPSP